MRVRAPDGKVCAIIGRNFVFPFQTIEDILFFGPKHIGVLNDNNFPFSAANSRSASAGIFMLLSAYADPTLKQKRPPVSGSADLSVVVQTLDPAGAMRELEAGLQP